MRSHRPRLAAFALVLSAFGCSSSEDASPPPRPKLPVVRDFGGPRMSHPDLVTITFAGDADRDALDAYSSWIVGSAWLVTVGGEYGVGPGSVEAPVHRSDAAPVTIDDTQIVDMLFAGLADGSIPSPSSGDFLETLYLFEFPPTTKITVGSPTSTAVSCIDFAGYHDSARRDGKEVAYAVVSSCPSTVPSISALDLREIYTSHEIIEAATDPVPGNHPAFRLARRDPWRVFGSEVADLCERSDERGVQREDGFVAQRSWSNLAASASDPCVPSTPAGPYFNVGATSGVTPRARPGTSVTTELVGWSTGAVTDWSLQAAFTGPVKPAITFGSASMNDGRTTSLTIGIPGDAPAGSSAKILVYSGHSAADYNAFPFFVVVGDDCGTFTRCDDCASHSGCGWCATSGRCERADGEASADSACSGDAFATWAGSCTGFCAGHDAACADCASQPGCGWCATPGGGSCHEARDDWSAPKDGACDNASWSFDPDYCP